MKIFRCRSTICAETPKDSKYLNSKKCSHNLMLCACLCNNQKNGVYFIQMQFLPSSATCMFLLQKWDVISM